MNYLVDFTPESTQSEIDDYLQSNNLTVTTHYDKLQKVYLVSGDAVPPKTSIVEFVVENHSQGVQLLDNTIVIDNQSLANQTITLTEDKEWWKLATFNRVDFDAQTQTFDVRGKKATIYLLDSGVDITHPEFTNRTVVNLFSFNNDPTDFNGHGTALASAMVGATCGITTATVKSAKIFDSRQPTLLSDMLAAFNAVLTDYINNGQKTSIVNLSWTVSKNEYLDDKINTLIDQGLIVVAAAGNNGTPIQDVTPVCVERVIKVGAYNQNLHPCDFSNYTGQTIISNTEGPVNPGALTGWAPGENIWVAGLNGTYGYVAGTSVSSAIVAATMAYNLDIYIDDTTGTVPAAIAPVNTGFIAFRRRNVLVLQSPYDNSANMIATAVVEHDLTVSDSVISAGAAIKEIPMTSRFGVKFTRKLFDIYRFNTITHGELPPGVTITNGFITGTLTKTTANNYERYIVPVTVSNATESVELYLTITGIDNLEQFIADQIPINAVNTEMDIILTIDSPLCPWAAPLSRCSDDGCDYYCSENYSAPGECVGTKGNCICSCL